MRLFIVFIMPLGVNIYTFCHRHINGFVYRVLSQTPLRTVSDAQNRHCIAFIKLKKKNLNPPKLPPPAALRKALQTLS